MVQGAAKIVPIQMQVCDKCGKVTNKSIHQHYLNGHLHCDGCNRNIDECCSGETANELYD